MFRRIALVFSMFFIGVFFDSILVDLFWRGPLLCAESFTPFLSLPAPKIIKSAAAYPGGNYEVENLTDGLFENTRSTEYASASRGTGTFVDFDFGRPTIISAFKHIDRNDPATVKSSRLTFSDNPGFSDSIKVVDVNHVNAPGGITFIRFKPVRARYVRWKVTAVASYTTVGGAEIIFFTSKVPEPFPSRISFSAEEKQVLVKRKGGIFQSLLLKVGYPYAESSKALLLIKGQDPVPVELETGINTVDIFLPEVNQESLIDLAIKVAGRVVSKGTVSIKPVRKWVVYFLPHSHVDIGFTHLQTEVEQLQWQNYENAIELARKTADYPAGSRFKWNVEVLWAVEGYFRNASEKKRSRFIDAVRRGWIGLDAMYGNELTGLCRPEELFHLMSFARRFSEKYGFKIDSAMISDVPGYSWGIVPAMVQSGVKYFSPGPNHMPNLVHKGDRIGYTIEAWGDRPFYWISPSGREKLFVWMSGHGYSWFHDWILGKISKAGMKPVLNHLKNLSARGYPYELVQLRYTTGGDNGRPDPGLPDFVKDWNSRYAYPKLVIATTSVMFHEFERRYADKIPCFRGDFTPYWEDGAGSSAAETALNRAASERLVQAQALWAILNPEPVSYPACRFHDAWRNVVLFSEHTWGAHNSVSQPESELARGVWKIKKSFALDAFSQSGRLLSDALRSYTGGKFDGRTFLVFNTSSWKRTDLVIVPSDIKIPGDLVKDSDGRPVKSQRLSSGELVFLAKDVPPLGSKRFIFCPGKAYARGDASAEGNMLSNGFLRVAVDSKTGSIIQLRVKHDGRDHNFVDTGKGLGLNEFFFLPGKDPRNAVGNGPAAVSIMDRGPLVASLVVESKAPGCVDLKREIRIIDGLDRLDIIDIVNMKRIRKKESVHFAFPFNVPGGTIRLDMAWSVVRPNLDQLEGANKNCFPVQRWVDVSNNDYGVTWATIDAPLVEVGGMVAETWDLDKSRPWIKKLPESQLIYSYVMNNYWHTNYKAYQEGRKTFRYSIRPHGQFDSSLAKRFGIERSQSLIITPASSEIRSLKTFLQVKPEGVIISSIKPDDGGKDLLFRLFNTTGHTQQVTLRPGEGLRLPGKSLKASRGDLKGSGGGLKHSRGPALKLKSIWRLDSDGKKVAEIPGSFEMSGWEVAEFKIFRE